ncbi:MAG TPA: hypothetical protein VFN08_17410, partial [Gemmatimonadales bacterium]|nr:hypothetical protein [Gemmatimonadales bacterium]
MIAYAADEAPNTGTAARCFVSLHNDGSVSVADNGRGTDTRYDEQGQPIKKPVRQPRTSGISISPTPNCSP